MNTSSQKFLLQIVRHTLEFYFENNDRFEVDESELSDEELKEKRGTFVTLHKFGQLRGCIGHIEPAQAVYQDVIDNALSAAFDDPRFRPLTPGELSEIDIEISALTRPVGMDYRTSQDLLNKLKPRQDGVIVKKGFRSATYLPQVWEDLKNKEEFMSSLCLKAGFVPDEWRHGKLEILIYQAEVFGEKRDI